MQTRVDAKIVLILLFVTLLFCNVTAQSGQKLHSSNLILENKFHYGFLIPHHIEMQLFNAHFMAYEISISKATFGWTRWEYMYNYPIIGISMWYSNLGNSEYFGSALAVYPFINFPLIKTLSSSFTFRVGFGLGYIEKPFDRIENYKNIAIGSHINAAANFMLEYSQKIGRRFIFSGGIGFVHFSNGSTKTPNYGINIPSVNAGLAFRLSKENKYLRKKLLPELYPFEFDGKKFIDLNISLGFGIKNMKHEYGLTFYAYSLTANIYKQVSYKSKIGVGFEYSYDGTDYFTFNKNNEDEEDEISKIQIARPGFHFAYELILSRVSLLLNLGFNFGGKQKTEGNLYEKVGVKYHITKKLFAHVTLKANGGRADYINYGLGYRFNIIYY